MNIDITLNQTLAQLGYSTEPADFQYKKHIIKDGAIIFTGDASEVWKWLADTDQIPL